MTWLTLETPDGPMRTYAASPAARTGRAVIVLQEAYGVNGHIRDVADRFAARGFLALAPDLFHRSGIGEIDYEHRSEAMAAIAKIGAEAIIADVGAVLSHLRNEQSTPSARTAIVGFCFGGRAAFTAAAFMPGIGAVVVFYGSGIPTRPHALLDRAAFITAPLLMHVGANDTAIPPEQVAAVESALQISGIPFEQRVYPGAGHAFANDARPSMFHPQAAAEAWARTYSFLDLHLPSADGPPYR